MAYCIIEWSILKKKIGSLHVRIVGRNLLKLRDIDTAELEKQIVEVKNNYRLKPLLKNQLRKLPPITGVLEDSKELIA